MKKKRFLVIIILIHQSLLGCFNNLLDQRYDYTLKMSMLLSAIPRLNYIPEDPPVDGPSISQYGITWVFDKVYQQGQFANGDYWVVGPVTIVQIRPGSKELLGTTVQEGFYYGPGPNASIRTMNGSMLNPSPKLGGTSKTQGYDSEMYVWDSSLGAFWSPAYDKNLNVALNVTPSNPLTVPVNSSLVSTISHPGGQRLQLATAAVLTVLSSAPPAGSFRPPYAGANKTIYFNTSQIQYNLLPSLSLSGITTLPSASNIAGKVKRVWIDHFNSAGDGTMHTSPSNNMPDYGREYTTMIGEASLLMMANEAELVSRLGITKSDIMVGLIQIGIDAYRVLERGGFWMNNGGLNQGRKWPIMFAGIMLNDYDMANVKDFAFQPVANIPGEAFQYPMTTPFAEDQTIFYVSQFHVDQTHVAYWGDRSHTPYVGPDQRDASFNAYGTTDIGLPEWGIAAQTNPTNCNNYWNTAYRRCCSGNAYAGIALTARIMESAAQAQTLWDNPAFFDYVDRFMQAETKNDWQRQMTRFPEQMWDRYRANYGTCYTGFSGGVRQYGNCAAAGVVK